MDANPTAYKTTRDRYTDLALKREPFLFRSRQFAALTVPSIMPPVGTTYTQYLPQPYFGLSGRAVLHLSAKMMAALMPAGSKIFRLNATPEALRASGQPALTAQQERTLSMIEDEAHTEVERRAWRPKLHLAMQHLIVTGNCLLHMLPNNTLKVYRLDQYVVLRDAEGKAKEIILQEPIDAPDEVLEPLIGTVGIGTQAPRLYTCAARQKDGTWKVHQEVEGNVVPGSAGTYPKGACPLIPLRWSEVVGEHYGRSKVEEHEADHRFGELLTKGVGDGAAIASRAVVMIKPNAAGGLNLRRRVRDARGGDVIVGNPDDVGFLNFQGVQGYQFAAEQLAEVKKDIATAYLMNSAAQRDAERVTAYELKAMIDEIEGTLGGQYTLMSTELMHPLVTRLMHQMQATGALPDLGNGMVEPTILTGLAALGREADFEKVGQAMELVGKAPPEAAAYIKWNEMFEKAMVGIGLSECVFTDQEVQQRQQQQAVMNAMQASAPPVAGQLAGAARDNMQPQAQPNGP